MKRLLFLLLFLFPIGAVAQTCSPNPTEPAQIDRAVSLRGLQAELAACAEEDCKRRGKALYGLAQVDGFVIDTETRDIILLGHRDAAAPALHLDDFVVMLRHALHYYAKHDGNTILTTAPGVSIDPRPASLRRLEKLMETSRDIETIAAQWPQFCVAPQDVRILGIPNSRAARIMLDADYLMKRFVNGQAQISLPGYASLSDLSFEAAKQAVVDGNPRNGSIAGLTRFWFAAGRHSVSGDTDVRMLDLSEVVLLDEAELLTRQGKIVAAAENNPLAGQFTCAFSRNYPEIASRPEYTIYAELDQVFRWTAIARLMVEEKAFARAGFRPDWLLDDYVLEAPGLPDTLPGVTEIRIWPKRGDPEYGQVPVRLVLPSCGGVTVDFSGLSRRVIHDGSGQLTQLREIVLFYRPALTAAFWDVFF